MNVTIIYENINKVNAYYNCVQFLLHNLKSNANLNITENFLSSSRNLSHSNLNNTINTNSHDYRKNARHIAKSFHKADLIIIACTTFQCDLSSEMKYLLNYLSYYYTNNKENILENNKIGLIISTASGAGLFHITRLIKKNLTFLGIPNIFNFSQNIFEGQWEYVDLKTKKQIAQKLINLSYKIIRLHNKAQLMNSQVFTKNIMKFIPLYFYNFIHYKKAEHINVI